MKKWKKLLALMMCVSMMCGLVACGGTEQAPEAESTAPVEGAEPENENGDVANTESSETNYEGEAVKIGFIGWGFTYTLG